MCRGKRVVVTGIGLRSPIGHTLAALRDGLLAGKSGVRAMPGWRSLDGLRTRVGAPCDGIDVSEIPRKYSRTMRRVGVLAALSVRDAITDAGLPADAGCLILEEYEHAGKRGANIYAEIIGYGQGCNSTHPTNSDPEGICIAVNAALRDAELAPSDIQHIALAAPTAGGMVES